MSRQGLTRSTTLWRTLSFSPLFHCSLSVFHPRLQYAVANHLLLPKKIGLFSLSLAASLSIMMLLCPCFAVPKSLSFCVLSVSVNLCPVIDALAEQRSTHHRPRECDSVLLQCMAAQQEHPPSGSAAACRGRARWSSPASLAEPRASSAASAQRHRKAHQATRRDRSGSGAQWRWSIETGFGPQPLQAGSDDAASTLSQAERQDLAPPQPCALPARSASRSRADGAVSLVPGAPGTDGAGGRPTAPPRGSSSPSLKTVPHPIAARPLEDPGRPAA